MRKNTGRKQLTAEITNAVLSFRMKPGDVAIPNHRSKSQEYDVLKISKDGISTDYEIKTCGIDLLNDFYKKKHKAPIAHYMYFVLASTIDDKYIKKIPERYGILIFRNQGSGHRFRELRKPSELKPVNAPIDFMQVCADLSARLKLVIQLRSEIRDTLSRLRNSHNDLKKAYERLLKRRFSQNGFNIGDFIVHKYTKKKYLIVSVEFKDNESADSFIIRDKDSEYSCLPFWCLKEYKLSHY